MAKKITLESLAAQMAAGFAKLTTTVGTLTTTVEALTTTVDKRGKEIHDLTDSVAHVVKHMATKEDIAEVRRDMATKDQVFALQVQVNSIEGQLKETRTEVRLGNLEEKVFGAPRR